MKTQSQKQRVAIIGGGVSGLSAAWHLHTSASHDVHLFESESRLGGHAHTLTLDTANKTCEEYGGGRDVRDKKGGANKVDVDVGFMVYNKGNYPNMTAWVCMKARGVLNIAFIGFDRLHVSHQRF